MITKKVLAVSCLFLVLPVCAMKRGSRVARKVLARRSIVKNGGGKLLYATDSKKRKHQVKERTKLAALKKSKLQAKNNAKLFAKTGIMTLAASIVCGFYYRSLELDQLLSLLLVPDMAAGLNAAIGEATIRDVCIANDEVCNTWRLVINEHVTRIENRFVIMDIVNWLNNSTFFGSMLSGGLGIQQSVKAWWKGREITKEEDKHNDY